MDTATIYAICLGSGATEFVCLEHLHEALTELAVNEAILSTGEAASTHECAFC